MIDLLTISSIIELEEYIQKIKNETKEIVSNLSKLLMIFIYSILILTSKEITITLYNAIIILLIYLLITIIIMIPVMVILEIMEFISNKEFENRIKISYLYTKQFYKEKEEDTEKEMKKYIEKRKKK